MGRTDWEVTEKWRGITRSSRMTEQMQGQGSSDPFKRHLTQFLARIGVLGETGTLWGKSIQQAWIQNLSAGRQGCSERGGQSQWPFGNVQMLTCPHDSPPDLFVLGSGAIYPFSLTGLEAEQLFIGIKLGLVNKWIRTGRALFSPKKGVGITIKVVDFSLI